MPRPRQLTTRFRNGAPLPHRNDRHAEQPLTARHPDDAASQVPSKSGKDGVAVSRIFGRDLRVSLSDSFRN
jgi:hypothetical protein